MSQPTDAASILATLQGMQNQAPQQPSPFSEPPLSPARAPWSPPAAPAPAPTIPGLAVNPPPNPFGVAAQAPQAQAPNLGATPQNSAGLSARLEETPEPAPAPAAKKSRKKAEPEPALSETAEKLLAEYVQDTLATNAKIRLACDALAYIATKMG